MNSQKGLAEALTAKVSSLSRHYSDKSDEEEEEFDFRNKVLKEENSN